MTIYAILICTTCQPVNPAEVILYPNHCISSPALAKERARAKPGRGDDLRSAWRTPVGSRALRRMEHEKHRKALAEYIIM